MKQDIKARLNQLRQIMQQAAIQAVIIPQTDPHQGEYIASHWQVRRFLSGFTGSAGSLVVTPDNALIWTDSRYFIQAAQQLDGSGIQLMKEGIAGTPDIIDYLCANLPSGSTVGINGLLFGVEAVRAMAAKLQSHRLSLRADFDPVDALWPDRPALPDAPAFIHTAEYTGEEADSKIKKVLAAAAKQGANAAFLSALDEVAWTLNLRSSDVRCNPVAIAYLYLAPQGSTLFINPAKIDRQTELYLNNNGVQVKPYTEVADFLAKLPIDTKVLIEPAKTSHTIASTLHPRGLEGSSPVAMLKACKNEVQISGTREAMARDGVAMVKALIEIERALANNENITEIDIATLLTRLRKEQGALDDSFETIAGFRGHGAIVHYSATPETNATLQPDGLLLIDSGGQYLDGTTDITRTITLGNPTDLQRRDFTLVMKGHIALARMIFPEGTTGHQLDVVARMFLWREGLTYLHGTGHGVGHFLNVHEGPQSIRLNYVPAPLTPGMITSNEPGLYREGIHGIRCENLVLTVPAMTTEFGQFLRFQTLTMCPFDIRLFDTSIMTPEEIEWVNTYHAEVYATLAPRLNPQEQQWLKLRTAPLTL